MKVKDLLRSLPNDPDAEVILYKDGEIVPASHVQTGEVIGGVTLTGPEFKSDDMTDDEFYDGYDRSLASVLTRAVMIAIIALFVFACGDTEVVETKTVVKKDPKAHMFEPAEEPKVSIIEPKVQDKAEITPKPVIREKAFPKGEPRVGEIWVWENNNPFDPMRSTYRVLAIKDGFVQYEDLSTGNIYSNGIHWFMVGSRRIK